MTIEVLQYGTVTSACQELAALVTRHTDAYQVGYESSSQFSREYSRMFGAPPIKDVGRLRTA